MRVRVVDNVHEFDALASQWNALVECAGASVFQTHEWQSTWWRSFGNGRSLHAVTLWDGQRLVGIAPLFLERVSLSPLTLLRKLRLVGSGHSDYLDVVVAPGYVEEAAMTIADHLCTFAGWHVIDLEDVPGNSPAVGPIVEAFLQRGCQTDREIHHQCYAVALPASSREYLAGFSAHSRKELLRRERRLFALGCEIRTLAPDAPVDEAMEEFIDLHKRQWALKGQRSGAFPDERTEKFHHEIARSFKRRGWLNLSFLTFQERGVAANYTYVYGDKVYSYLSALELQTPLTKLSPGTMLDFCSIQRAIAIGLREYDFMRGAEQFKHRFRANETLTWRYEIAAPHRSAHYRATARRTVRTAASLGTRLIRKARRTFVWATGT